MTANKISARNPDRKPRPAPRKPLHCGRCGERLTSERWLLPSGLGYCNGCPEGFQTKRLTPFEVAVLKMELFGIPMS